MIDWTSIDESGPEEGAMQLEGLLAEIDQALRESPHVRDLIAELLHQQLESRPVDDGSLGRIIAGLATLLGLDTAPGTLLWWIVLDDSGERLEAVARLAPPAVGRVLRDTLTLHWARLADAARRWEEVPENWALVTPTVNHDVLTDRYRIELDIKKFSGETVSLTCEPDSLLVLATTLVRTLIPLASVNPFTPDRVDEFRSEASAFWDTIEEARAVGETGGATDGTTPEGPLQG